MANDYVGRYGEALRKLHALEQQPSTEIAGAFGQSPSPQTGAFGAPPAPTRQAFQDAAAPMFDPQKPISAGDLYKQMPTEAKDAMAAQLKAQGINVDEAYAREVKAGNIPAQEKTPSHHEKIGYLAEVALRTISNLGREGTNSSADWADAVLATDARREGVSERERQEARQDTKEQSAFDRTAAAEQRARAERLSEREEDRGTRTVEREADKKDRAQERASDRAFTRAENAANRKAAAEERKAGRQPRVLTDEKNDVFTLDDDGNAKPVMTEKTVSKEKRGKRNVKYMIQETVKEQLRTSPKPNASDVDQDTIVRAVNDRFKVLKEDRKLIRELKTQKVQDVDKELSRRAYKQVVSQFTSSTQESAPARKSNLYVQFDE